MTPRMLRVASDSHLVALIREGRRAAFEALYDRHHRAMLSFCHHMLGNPEEAEDAVQHTFLAAYNALVYSDEPIHLRAWLFAIARNRCYSVLRRRRDQPLAAVAEPTMEGLATQVLLRQDLRDLVHDVRRLPDDQRAALVLAELDGLSHEQIALVLGVPTRKVKALVFQARESLVASRTARDTDCAEIREQLANLHGGALRRSNLRRHLRDCAGCREFRQLLDDQRGRLRVLVPVAPTLAMKEALLAGTVGGGVSGGLTGGGVVATSTVKGVLVKTLVGAVLAGAGAAGTIVAVRGLPRTSSGHATPKYALSGRVPPGGAAKAGGGSRGSQEVSGSANGPPSPRITLAALALPARNRLFAVAMSSGDRVAVSLSSRSKTPGAGADHAVTDAFSFSPTPGSTVAPPPSRPQDPGQSTGTDAPTLMSSLPSAGGGSGSSAGGGSGSPGGGGSGSPGGDSRPPEFGASSSSSDGPLAQPSGEGSTFASGRQPAYRYRSMGIPEGSGDGRHDSGRAGQR